MSKWNRCNLKLIIKLILDQLLIIKLLTKQNKANKNDEKSLIKIWSQSPLQLDISQLFSFEV